jgi:hypothetical protein
MHDKNYNAVAFIDWKDVRLIAWNATHAEHCMTTLLAGWLVLRPWSETFADR